MAQPSASTAVTFPFNRDFQIGILALASQRAEFTTAAVELIHDSYFEDDHFIWFFQRIREYFTKYAMPPTARVLDDELRKGARSGKIKSHQFATYVEIYKQLHTPLTDADHIETEVVRFCRRQAGRKVFLETGPLMDTADDATWDLIVDKITRIPTIGLGLQSTGIDPTNWDIQSDPPRTAVGIYEADDTMRGGLKPGQLGAFIGGPGSGKSLALLHVAIMSMFRGLRALYISLELGENDIAERFTAAAGRIPLGELHHRQADVMRAQRSLHKAYADLVKLKFFPTATVNTIRAYMRMLSSQGWRPDILLVDYGDLLSVTDSKGSDYADQGNAFAELRVLAGEQGIPCWTATQATRGAFQAEKVTQEHVADSMRKARICDVLIGISAKPEERKDHIARLNFAKNRNGRENIEVTIKTNYAMAQFCDIINTAQLLNAQAGPAGTPPPAMPPMVT